MTTYQKERGRRSRRLRGLDGSSGPDGFGALADPTRRAIFESLASEPSPVGQLARELPVSRPAVSQHLKVLRDAGLVTDRREGNRRIYRVDPAGVGAMRDYLDSFWSDALAAYGRAAEREGSA